MDGRLKAWPRTVPPQVRVLRGHSGSVLQIAFSPDGKQVAYVAQEAQAGPWFVFLGGEKQGPYETIGDEEIPSFRGHIVNQPGSTAAARVPDPDRLVQAEAFLVGVGGLMLALSQAPEWGLGHPAVRAVTVHVPVGTELPYEEL